ncbi:MAG TPA: YbfB/YjiJ family MFS transporter, partial [Ramlibacter sp.]|nr:YbfB/YjiJ family MFS transporter [Ramlibacter sp.]
LLLMLPVALVLARVDAAVPPAAVASAGEDRTDAETRGLILCYGLMGFGYILPATFLPALARTLVDDPRWFGLAWPVFGATAAVSTAFTATLFRRSSRIRVWAAGQLLMGAGVLLPSLWLHAATIVASALLVGGTFMVITLAGVQEMRARAPAHTARLVGRITAAFALGQIAGPVASTLLLRLPIPADAALALALQLAAIGLLASGAWLWRRTVPASPDEEIANA